MNEAKKDLVVGVFEQEAQAEQAVAALWRAGFAPDRIDMANRRMGVVPGTPRLQFQQDAAEGATTGAVAGAGAGAVAGAVAGSILSPGVGTVLGGLGGAALGAAGGAFVGPFLAMDIAEEDAHHYSDAINQGRTLVIVRQIGRADEARQVVREHGGFELQDYLVQLAKH
jgi:hypothetical protein